MKIIPSNYENDTELPFKIKVSFEAIYTYLENIEQDKNHVYHASAKQLLEKYNKYPILREGFENLDHLYTYHKEIGGLLDILFPDLLESNEVKAGSIPFEFTSFKLTKRFHTILENAPEDFQLKLRNYDHSNIFIMSCTFILMFHYDIKLDFKRPFYFDIPDKKTGLIKNYRTLFNGDFFKIEPLPNAPKLSETDIKSLLDNFDNIDLWREKFPPESYEFKGFGLMTLVDMTLDQSISNIKESLLDTSQDAILKVEKNISNLFNSKEIKFEFSSYSIENNKITYNHSHKQRSFVTYEESPIKGKDCSGYFCSDISDKVFKSRELVAISDLESYAEQTNNNGFSQILLKQGFKSVILVPLKLNEDNLGVMELVSPNKYELNSLNAIKLKDVIPAFKVAAHRYMEEFENKIESIIQTHYTSIHPTVKWKFLEAAEYYLENSLDNNSSESLNEIIFDDVIPLYGQSDIKGSSLARNTSIQKDLVKQLEMAFDVIEKAKAIIELPIYNDLQFRISEYSNNLKHGLNSGDEDNLTHFLKTDIYPVFNHLKTLDLSLKNDIEEYMNHLDSKLHVVYNERKKYDESVNILNENLAKFIDSKQIEAQKMFPHYFERYKTDGIDYNMYIGQSLIKNKTYDKIYLYNLRLWQLQMMCELENVAYNLTDQLEHPLEVASLILVHNTPLTIKFRMDEKRFDVDGAYNIRYEILKKRIDKAHIKNTNERLTIPGKIAIVYSQDNEAEEYLKYIKHLQVKNYVKKEIEILEIEDLQGSTGLKAIRIEINYKKDSDTKIALNDLMDVTVN
jgi:hypothetical protein